jgi:hypothetical protein
MCTGCTMGQQSGVGNVYWVHNGQAVRSREYVLGAQWANSQRELVPGALWVNIQKRWKGNLCQVHYG